jgi:hypothetical protein
MRRVEVFKCKKYYRFCQVYRHLSHPILIYQEMLCTLYRIFPLAIVHEDVAFENPVLEGGNS